MKTAVILTTQRTGSTFLCFWINSHPYANVYNEVFLKTSPAHDAFRHYYINNCGNVFSYSLLTSRIFYKFGINFFRNKHIYGYLGSLVNNPAHSAPFPKIGKGQQHHAKNPYTKLVAFKLMYDQLYFYASIKKWIVSNQTFVIHLQRRNILKNFISKERSRQLDISHTETGIQYKPIQFNFRRFQRYAYKIEKEIEYNKAMFRGTNPYFDLYYEDIFEDLATTRQKILSFLEIENLDISVPDLKKIASSSLAQEIYNTEQAEKAIGSSKYSYMLNDFTA